MALTKKRRGALEDLTPDRLVIPDSVVFTYAVCSVEKDACGWGGWLLEAAFVNSDSEQSKPWGGKEPLPAVTHQICPRCGRGLYRTDSAQFFNHSSQGSVAADGRLQADDRP